MGPGAGFGWLSGFSLPDGEGAGKEAEGAEWQAAPRELPDRCA